MKKFGIRRTPPESGGPRKRGKKERKREKGREGEGGKKR